MAKTSPNDITSLTLDWGMDPRNGLPFSGRAVLSFIKEMFNDKIGAAWFDNSSMTLWFFRNEEDKLSYIEDNTLSGLIMGSTPMSFSTLLKRIKITPHGNTVINATVNQDSINLVMDVVVQLKELSDPNWTSTGQDIMAKVYLDLGNTGNYVELYEQKILSSVGTISVNIKPYLQNGTSRIKFYFYIEDDISLSNSQVWTVTLSEMYIEEWNNTWYNALIESGSDSYYHLGGFRIIGAIPKTLHILICTASTVVASYAVDIGTLETYESPYYFTRNSGLNLANPTLVDGTARTSLPTGIYNVIVWLTSGNLTTYDNRIMYNIMYIATGTENSARIVVMNNSGKTVNNYDESAHLCDYAVYNAGQEYGYPTITITPYISGIPEEPVIIELLVFSLRLINLIYNINLITNSPDLYITYRIDMKDNYQQNNSYVDNSEIFPSAEGATFYLNPSIRSNGESTKEILYNNANNQLIPIDVTWEKMSWVDEYDGWTNDEDGRKCLLLPARSKLIIPPNSIRFLTGDNVTYEFCFKVKNVSDYNENIISIALYEDLESFTGIRIKPTNITVHSLSDISDVNDIYQGTNFVDEELIHLVVTICRSFDGRANYNVVTGYINGIKGFQFSYSNGTIWANTYALAIFGSDKADLYLYMFRFYNDRALSSSEIENNWLNSLEHRVDKVAYKDFIHSVLSPSSRQISYETIKNNEKYNFFVVEMLGNNPNVPNINNPDGGLCNVEMHYGLDRNGNSRSNWDWKIYNVECKGQGTTSMNYYLWNIRWRIDKSNSTKKCPVAYYDTPEILGNQRNFVEREPEDKKTVDFDGQGNHPAVKRITAKINFASSMQDHKMGATRAYNLLHNEIMEGELLNEAQLFALTNNLPMPSVAVYQYPAFGFLKVTSNVGLTSYEFIGLFTIGPDKGDKPTFGYDLVESDLISLEGVDHTPQMAKFNVPWDELTVYNVNDKGDGFISIKAPLNNFINAFEVGVAKDGDTEDASSAMPILENSFKDAYDIIYNNSTLIFPIALDDSDFGGIDAQTVLANINNNIEAFLLKRYNDRLLYADMEFWIEGEYNLYHFEYENQQYVSGYKSNNQYNSPLNLINDTGVDINGLTLDEINEAFKAARRERFLQEAPLYWEMNELAFNYAYLLIFAATDNFAKNQYPIYMGGKWRFRLDDLDTIMDIDNNGGQTKPSYIEYNDSINGSPYFAGSNSVLWNLVNESMWEDFTDGVNSYSGIKTIGKNIIDTMSSLSGGANRYDGFIKFFDEYFWKNAQEYFPPSAYNIDGNIKYEAAWLSGRTFSADPLRQSLGSHYLAEKLWTQRRAIYCMSLFLTGPFGDYANAYLGRIQFRPISLGSMTLTPSYPMYPCLIIGDNEIRPTLRTFDNEEYTFNNLTSDGNTVYTLLAVDYLSDLGDLKNLQLGSDDGGNFNLSGKKLTQFKMGDEDSSQVTTTVKSLIIDSQNGLPCLETIDVRNASDLSGILDLTKCKRLKEVYTEGSKVSSVILPRGSKIETLHLSDFTNLLSYHVVKYLSDLNISQLAVPNINLINLEQCDILNGIDTLYEIYSSDNQDLRFIKIIKEGEEEINGLQVSMLANILLNKDKNGNSHNYNGINQEGSGDVNENPRIEGSLLLDKYYQPDLDVLKNNLTPEDSINHPGMKKIIANYFGPLNVIYPIGDDHVYISFEDDNVKTVCLRYSGDGIGVTKPLASEVTLLTFNLNTLIITFDEFKYFTSIVRISDTMFFNCSNLTHLGGWERIEYIGRNSFLGCSSLADDINLRDIIDIGNGTTGYIYSPFQLVKSLKIIIGEHCTNISTYAFYKMNRLNTIIINATTPPTLGAYAIPSGVLIYVPDASYNDYISDTNWSAYASSINTISELPTT